MKKPLATMIPLLARGLAPTAAVASSLLSPVAMGASGDLDPTFADVGRMTDLNFAGPAWSLEPLEEDGVLFAGGDACQGWYCGYYYDYAYGFVGQLSGTGSLDPSFAVAQLRNVEVFDVALQPDGKVIAVGRTVESDRDRSSLTIFRLERDGALDPTFGEEGIVRATTTGLRNSGEAVAIDPDRRIVVAGSENSKLIVMRLLPDGTFDHTFGSSGVFLGPTPNQVLQRIHILRTGNGGYRLFANSFSSCHVVALTSTGELDESFGIAGVALVGQPPEPRGRFAPTTRCNSMAAQSDGGLLLVGNESNHAFATRLLASGVPDASFVTDVIPYAMADATALTVGPDDSVLVAGRGPSGVSGALVVRLQADGELDALFGNAGSTWIDLPFIFDVRPAVHDMTVLPDGRVVAAGGSLGAPFVVRLLGDGGEGGPGVVGIKHAELSVKEDAQQVVVTVRRMGGDTGSISVAYQTVENEATLAVGGADYTEVSGRLTWEDGDATEREIVVPIAQGDGTESSEWFGVSLDDAQGGAGLGTSSTLIEIVGDAPPIPPEQPQGPSAGLAARHGGGALGFLSLMLFAVVRLFRALQPRPGIKASGRWS